jgi:hypothetical protein
MDDVRYAEFDEYEDDNSPQAVDERIAVVRAALAIEHQMVDKASALRHVLNRAYEDAVHAVIELLEVDANDAKAVRDLQWKVGRYNAMYSYINEVLADGQEKADLLTAEQAGRLSEIAENMVKDEQVTDLGD